MEGNPFSNRHTVPVAKGNLALCGRLRMAASPTAWLQEWPKRGAGQGGEGGQEPNRLRTKKSLSKNERNGKKKKKIRVLGGAGREGISLSMML